MAVSTVHHFVVEPLKGVGPIRFGMHKDDVSRAFTYVYASFFKGSDSKVRADHCEVVGLIIHYDDASRVNYIEVHKARYATVPWSCSPGTSLASRCGGWSSSWPGGAFGPRRRTTGTTSRN